MLHFACKHVVCRAAKEQQQEEQEERRLQAAYDQAVHAKAQLRSFKRVRLDSGAQPAAGLPAEVWGVILGMLIDARLWDLSFVRDICNAGMHSAAAGCCTQGCLWH